MRLYRVLLNWYVGNTHAFRSAPVAFDARERALTRFGNCAPTHPCLWGTENPVNIFYASYIFFGNINSLSNDMDDLDYSAAKPRHHTWRTPSSMRPKICLCEIYGCTIEDDEGNKRSMKSGSLLSITRDLQIIPVSQGQHRNTPYKHEAHRRSLHHFAFFLYPSSPIILHQCPRYCKPRSQLYQWMLEKLKLQLHRNRSEHPLRPSCLCAFYADPFCSAKFRRSIPTVWRLNQFDNLCQSRKARNMGFVRHCRNRRRDSAWRGDCSWHRNYWYWESRLEALGRLFDKDEE